jgi:RNA polymerase sigma factor (sigma-70 family)
MPADPRGGVAHLSRTLLRAATDLTDGQLLDRFLAGREEAAFEAVVRRHGPMVLGVCRRILGNAADADDAFQATFVVLVRRARELAGRGTVGDFLYGVAYHTALKARAQAVKRRVKEARVAPPECDPAGPAERDELLRLLDRELARLPGKYREPVVLCDLEGRSRAEVAALLGIPEGTLSSRLTTARRTLAGRLSRHGLAVSAGAVAAALDRSAEAGVPTSLVGAAVRAAGGAVPAAVARLAAEVSKMMLLGKLKAGAVGLAAVVALGVAVALAAPGQAPAGKPEPPAKAADKPAAKPDEPAWQKGLNELYALADGEVLKRVTPPYPAARAEYLKAQSLFAGDNPPPADDWIMTVRWDGKRAEPWSFSIATDDGQGKKAGHSVIGLIGYLAGVEPVEVDAPQEIKQPDAAGEYVLPGVCDFVVRKGAAAEKVIPRLREVLKKDYGLDLSMTFEQQEREVVVARGQFKPAPLEGREKNRVEVYAKQLVEDNHFGGGGSGTLAELLTAVGNFVGKQIVNETEAAPKTTVSWRYHYRDGPGVTEQNRAEDVDPDAVLKNVAVQTGLTFKTETRKVRVLVVEKADEKKQKAREHAAQAYKREQAKRYDEAIAELTKAVDLDPTFEGAYFTRSGIYAGRPEMEKRDYKAAVGDLTTILVLNPTDYAARFNRALNYEFLGEYDKVIADYTQIIAGPTDFSRYGSGKDAAVASTHFYRGRAYHWYKKDPDKAIADFTEALRLNPKVNELAYYYRAQCHRAKRMWKEAGADYAAGVERDPGYPNVLNEWARQLATCPDPKCRDGKKAAELADRAREMNGGKSPTIFDTLAAAYAEAGKFVEAVEWQKKAIGLTDPKAAEKRESMEARLKLYEAGKPYREEGK